MSSRHPSWHLALWALQSLFLLQMQRHCRTARSPGLGVESNRGRLDTNPRQHTRSSWCFVRRNPKCTLTAMVARHLDTITEAVQERSRLSGPLVEKDYLGRPQWLLARNPNHRGYRQADHMYQGRATGSAWAEVLD